MGQIYREEGYTMAGLGLNSFGFPRLNVFGCPRLNPLGFPLGASPLFLEPAIAANVSVIALFDTFPIGARIEIGMDSSFWIGNFGGIQDGVALLTNAVLHSNIGNPIDGIRPVVRIPLGNITFVST